MTIFVAVEDAPGVKRNRFYRTPDDAELISRHPGAFMKLDDIPGAKPPKRQSNGWGDGPVGEEWFPSSGDVAQQWRESN